MKKQVLSAILLIALALSFFSCASTEFDVKNYEPIAVVSVIGNKTVPWYEEKDPNKYEDKKSGGTLTAAVTKFFDSDNPEFSLHQERIDYLEESVRMIISDMLDVEVLDKKDVVESEIYKKTKIPLYSILPSTANATGYKDLSVIAGKRAKDLARGLGAKSLIVVQAEFNKKSLKGNGLFTSNVSPYVKLTIKLIDETGKVIKNKYVELVDDEKLEVAGTNYDKDALVALFPNLIDDAIRQYIMTYLMSE